MRTNAVEAAKIGLVSLLTCSIPASSPCLLSIIYVCLGLDIDMLYYDMHILVVHLLSFIISNRIFLL
jgi:hypothetical protein